MGYFQPKSGTLRSFVIDQQNITSCVLFFNFLKFYMLFLIVWVTVFAFALFEFGSEALILSLHRFWIFSAGVLRTIIKV